VAPLALLWSFILREICSDDLIQRQRGWKLFLLQGAMLLANRTARGGGRGAVSQTIKARIKRFDKGEWSELFEAYTSWRDNRARRTGHAGTGHAGQVPHNHKSCAELIKRGQLSKAARRLGEQTAFAPVSDETVAALRQLHPSAAGDPDPEVWSIPEDLDRISVDTETLLTSVARMPRGKAPSFSGIRAEMFQ